MRVPGFLCRPEYEPQKPKDEPGKGFQCCLVPNIPIEIYLLWVLMMHAMALK